MIHPEETLIDIIVDNDMTYILGCDSKGYFIYMNSMKVDLLKASPIISKLGNIIINRCRLYVLIPFIGDFMTSDGRKGHSIDGLLITLTLGVKLLGIRYMKLSKSFLLVGSLSGTLFLLNGSTLTRFNPATSPSWNTPIDVNFVSGCSIDDYVLVIYSNIITTYSSRTGLLLSRQSVINKLFACQTIQSKVYIVAENLLIYGTVSNLGYTITGSQSLYNLKNPILCNLGSYSYGYVVATESTIYLYNNIDNTITTIPITGLSTINSHRIIPPNSTNIIPCILNMITSIGSYTFSHISTYSITAHIQPYR